MALAAVTTTMVLGTTCYSGLKTEISEDSWMKLSFLGQAHFKYEDKAADQEDFYLRRGRIILSGQVADGIKFFAETDNDNAGKNGTSNVSTDIQDAFIDFRLLETDFAEVWIAGGLILLPFSFENKSSAASLLGIDYNAEVVKFVNSFVWRDYGAELHGNLGKKVAYHVGAFDGYDPYSTGTIEKNEKAALRYTGHIAVNVLGDAQTGWFYSQDRLADGNYISLGAGFDTQEKATRTISTNKNSAVQNSDAWVLDVQSGFDIGIVDLTVNAAYYDWDNGLFAGNTAFVESGARIDKVELTGKWSLVDPDTGKDTTDYTAGMNYYFKKQNTKVGAEFRWGDSNDTILCGVQVLL
ncbi:hypothetical protein H8D64_00825 [PVC group bacterium]|nr:hypothetical protein [PVC group bacterium]